MTRLTELKLKNFKSFKKAHIPLRKGFTVMIGANGSGKSNILDALLFVLGTTSLKLLRVPRLTDLINSNAKEDYAKVELTVKDDDKDYIISRTIDKTGKSIFRLNNDRKALHEINELLLNLNIKNDGHNISTQGDITKIVSYSPDQRRQIIDEISGIVEFEEKKKEAGKELLVVEEKIRQAGTLLQEKEKRLKQIEEEKKAAEEFGELNLKMKKIKGSILSGESKELEHTMNEIKKKIDKTSGDKEKIMKEKNLLIEQQIMLSKEFEEINNALLEENQKIYSEIISLIEQKKSEEKLLQERMNSSEKFQKEKELQLEITKKSLNEKNSGVFSLNERIQEIMQEIGELEAKIKQEGRKSLSVQDEISKKENKIKELEGSIESKNKDIEKKIIELAELKKENSLKETEMHGNKEELKKAKEKLAAAEKEFELLNDKNLELKLLIEKHGEPEQTHRETEKKIIEYAEEQHKMEGIIEASKNHLKQLEQTAGNCPLCRNKVTEQIKKALIEEKKNEIKHKDLKGNELKEKIKALNEEKNLLLNASFRKRELTALVSGIEDRKKSLEELKERVQKLGSMHFEGKKELIESKEREVGRMRKERESVQEELKTRSMELKKLIEKSSKSEIEAERDLLMQEQRFSEKRINEIKEEEKHLMEKKNTLEMDIKDLNEAIGRMELELKESRHKAGGLVEKQRHAEKMLEEKLKKKEATGRKLEQLKEKISSFDIKERKFEKEINTFMLDARSFEVRIEDMKEELKDYFGIELFKTKPLKELKAELPNLERKLEKLGTINLKALESFDEIKREFNEMNNKVIKLDEERGSVMKMISNIEVKRNNIFMDCFNKVNKNFREMFQNFFDVDGFLDLTDREKPLESGLLIQVIKNNKKLSIDSLSGGEKALTALAFIFAIQLFDPSPFYALDESDAALDKENSIKVAKVIKKISSTSQFMAITHNDSLIMNADQIIGTALNEDNSSAIGMDLREKVFQENS